MPSSTASDHSSRPGSSPRSSTFAATRTGTPSSQSNGTEPLPASSGRTVRHWFNPGGNRQLNRSLYTVAFTQIRSDTEGRAYNDRDRAAGKTKSPAPSADRHASGVDLPPGYWASRRRCRRAKSRNARAVWSNECVVSDPGLVRTGADDLDLAVLRSHLHAKQPVGYPGGSALCWWRDGVAIGRAGAIQLRAPPG